MKTDDVQFRITITENGPYIVTEGVPLIWRYIGLSVDGDALEWQPVGAEVDEAQVGERYVLCRCGQSANKPFCDGSHARLGFDGSLVADRQPSAQRRQTFEGSGILMTDDRTLCSHAGFCGTRLANVHEMIKRTGDPEVRARVMHMVANCPSGRLQVSREGDPIEPEYLMSIATVLNGPLWVRGGIPLEAPDGFVYEIRNRMTLCRCGQSQNKPFCDGSHEKVGFKAP